MGNLSQQAGKTLYSWIAVEKRFRPGEKLPNEVELSAQLGVSRATLREALRALLVQGVVEVRRGRGTFVTQRAAEVEDFGFDDLARVKGQLRDLFELRSIFEPKAARLACQRATEEELRDGVQAVIATVDGSCGTHGFVTDSLPEQFDTVCACGPMPMLKALCEKADRPGQFSLEARMGCGFGACMGCTIDTANGPRRVCREGPVFRREELLW